MSTFGSRIRSARVALGWTQEQLGFEMGVTKATISKWEADAAEPGITGIRRLRTLLGMTLEEMIDGARPPASSMAVVGETREHYVMAVDHRRAADLPEETLLRRFRMLSPTRRRALLEFIKPGED